MTPAELLDWQWQRLTVGVETLWNSQNRFYLAKFGEAGLTRQTFRTWEDFARLPFTTKEELLDDQQAHPPYGSNLSFPVEQYVRLHQTSGTSGRKLRWLDTRSNWEWVLDCWQHLFAGMEITPHDRLFFPFSFGPFLGFWAAFDAASRLGALTLPGGGMTSTARLQFLMDHQATVVFCTPTYALRLAEVAEAENIPLAESTVRALVLAGEPGGNIPAVRGRIESAFGARVFDHSGMTEIGPLGVEYASLPGKLFILGTHAIAEFIDPETTQPVAEGELGEMVLTNLGRWGSPLIRYRTGDLVRARRDVHPKGKPFYYLEGGILARSDDMLWIKGNNVYPSTIEETLRRLPQIGEYQLIAEQQAESTLLWIEIEQESEPTLTDEDLASLVRRSVQDRFHFRPEVRVVAHASLPRYEMKARRFFRR